MSELIQPPTETEYIAHLHEGLGENCLVCDQRRWGGWTDYNGQIRCSTCGTTWQALGSHHSEEWLAKQGMKKEDVARTYCDCFDLVPLLRAYFRETSRKVPLGCYLGRSPITQEESDNFYKWVTWSADRFRPAWDDRFNWEGLLAEFGSSVTTGMG